ncbi:adenosylmethionine--8-amino-7-oxononanoate aminotransferase BioA [Kordiimonas sediminis]|uniref:Adenosylmethionine-8-amino-7-oxononanoate aminotransferase n=1 Tax=Kordiimonas sediminis TaxID=1735581 RepID=A0A919E7S5_9PROT|nr:adenosylmethionine--8-amino-7-oxononanoate transaminase [Kordiimonas sediminis]GHF22860.1 adenosylmethionine--8-amino-7-oxononanoate aminotransferase BioA [Kordiimonas sediminis]
MSETRKTIQPSDTPDWFEKGLDHIWLPYTQMKTMVPPVGVAGTSGTRIQLEDGRELIDGIASWWAAVHGYNHPVILEAMRAQLDTMPHVMLGGLVHEPVMRLSTRLASLLPGDLNRCFIAESGSVSVEVAMKMCAQYFLNRGEPRTKFVHFRGGYHGDTLGTMGICDPEEGMHHIFGGMIPQNLLADLPRTAEEAEKFADFLIANKSDIAAVITEPLVQGAGGMLFHSPDTLRWIRKACDDAGVLLILDEIFTGLGRTGTMFALDQAGIIPDVVTLSKALSGGVTPLSVAIARDEIFAGFYSDNPEHALMHGPTYMGHALGCAAANASLDLFEKEDRLGAARWIGEQMAVELAPCSNLPCVADIRTLGAIGVVEIKDPSIIPHLKKRFIEKGVWIRPFRNIVYLTPALTIQRTDLSKLTHTIFSCLKEI